MSNHDAEAQPAKEGAATSSEAQTLVRSLATSLFESTFPNVLDDDYSIIGDPMCCASPFWCPIPPWVDDSARRTPAPPEHHSSPRPRKYTPIQEGLTGPPPCESQSPGQGSSPRITIVASFALDGPAGASTEPCAQEKGSSWNQLIRIATRFWRA